MKGWAAEVRAASGGLDADDLLSPETYARECRGFHTAVMAHRRQRTVRVGPNVELAFEDALTIRMQLQETLRMERITEPADVRAEIDAGAALIPDGSNFKATMLIGFASAEERLAKLAGLAGVERSVWMQVDGSPRFYAVACEGPRRAASSAPPVEHYLRLELDKTRVRDVRKGHRLSLGIDHDAYRASLALGDELRRLLLLDLR